MRWTDEEINIVAEKYQTLEKKELLELLPNRTWNAVQLKAQRHLGLHRYPNFGQLDNKEAKSLTDAEQGYLAGAIDCDGCICIADSDLRGKRWVRPRLDIVNTNRALVKKCQEITGIGSICARTSQRKRWRQSYVWYLPSRVGIRSLLQQIKNLLVRKKKQAELVIEFINIWDTLKQQGNYLITSRQLEILREVRLLNRRGR